MSRIAHFLEFRHPDHVCLPERPVVHASVLHIVNVLVVWSSAKALSQDCFMSLAAENAGMNLSLTSSGSEVF